MCYYILYFPRDTGEMIEFLCWFISRWIQFWVLCLFSQSAFFSFPDSPRSQGRSWCLHSKCILFVIESFNCYLRELMQLTFNMTVSLLHFIPYADIRKQSEKTWFWLMWNSFHQEDEKGRWVKELMEFRVVGNYTKTSFECCLFPGKTIVLTVLQWGGGIFIKWGKWMKLWANVFYL